MLPWLKKRIPFLLVLFLGWLYLSTLAPGLTWAFDSADSGDLLTALATGGVPHPGGYPTYLFFASLFTKLPFGSLAFLGNLFSFICMLLAVLFMYFLVKRLTGEIFVAALSALLFGTFPLVWSQALITEVYGLHTLLSILVLYFLILDWNSGKYDFVGGLVLGLAIGNHLTALFLLPFMLLINYEQDVSRWFLNLHTTLKTHSRFIALRLLGLAFGLGVFLTIPLRARAQAPVNWGNAVDWDGFWWLASGEMYQSRLTYFSFDYLLAGTRLWSQLLIDQMGIVGLSIAILYIVVLFRPTILHFGTVYLLLVNSSFAILFYSPDSYVYLILPLLAFAIWIALGCQYLITKFSSRSTVLPRVIIYSSIALVVFRAILAIPTMDLSKDQQAENYAQTILDTLPENAIILTQGDESTFSLWYFHFGNGQRPDASIISNNLFEHEWYRESMRVTYPDLRISDTLSIQILTESNPMRPVCMLATDLKPQFECFFYLDFIPTKK